MKWTSPLNIQTISHSSSLSPSGRRRLLRDSFTLGTAQLFRPRLATLEATETPQRHGSGVLGLLFGLGHLPRGLLDDVEGEYVRIGWTLPALA
jgi:hypothetical protein